MTIDEKVEAYRMRLEGKTFQEIGEHFAVSKQCIQQMLPKRRKKLEEAIQSCIYPNIARWMEEHEAGYAEIARQCGRLPQTVGNALSGRTGPSKTLIDQILQVIGLTYEQAFKEDTNDA